MKKILFFLLISIGSFAQTGIGTTTPNASAKLDVFSDTKGFLPPRVALTSTSAFSPITGLSDASSLLTAAGLIVYNTATINNVTPGYYYWNGTAWIRLITPADNATNVTGTVAVVNGGTGTSTGSITGTGALTFTAGGTNQNITLTPSGTGNVLTNSRVGIGTNSPSATLEIGASNGSIPGSLVLNPTTTGTGVEGAEINIRPAPVTTSPAAQTWVIDQVSNANNPRLRFFPGNTGESRGFSVLDNGNFGIGMATPTAKLNLVGGGIKIHNGFSNNMARPALNAAGIGNYEIRGVGSITGSTQEDLGDDGFLRLSAGGGTNVSAQSSIDLSGFSTQSELANNIVMRTLGTERVRITNEGRVGIGTNSPAAPLHVAPFVNQNVNTYGIFNFAGVFGNNSSGNHAYSIQADQFIRASQFHAISDARIKNKINPLNSQKQLSELNKLQVVNFAYIDQLANGKKSKTGFIAQEVESVNSQFVNQSTDFIPSVFALAKSAKMENTSLHVRTDKPHGFQKGDEVKFFAEGKKEVIRIIEEVKDAHLFSVTGWNESRENLFIYGKKVTDFRAIDFDQITALSVAAIQELSKQVDKLKLENQKLSQEIQMNQADFENRLRKLESKSK
jgi:hypothetical protein